MALPGSEPDLPHARAQRPGDGAAPADPAHEGEVAARRTVTLPAEPASASIARRMLREVLTAAGREDCLDVAELACTELVTNAVLHAHTDIEVRVEVRADVRVEVRDLSAVMPTAPGYDTRATTGRGLALVAALSDDHGVDAGPAGKTVWFTVGGPGSASREEAVVPWDLEGWQPDQPSVEAPAEVVPPRRTVRLLGLPPTLWLAARRHHDALLRELVLYLAHRDSERADVAATDAARHLIATAVLDLLRDAQHRGIARPAVPSGHPSPLPWVPPTLDVDVVVPVDLGPAFAAMQDALDLAEDLARSGRLLIHPGLPEVIAMRDWMCEQVVAQLAGIEPAPWSGTDHERFLDRDDAGFLDGDPRVAAVREEVRGVVAADDSNRIVAVSRPLAELTGWDVEDLVGRRVVALIPPRLREAHVAGFTRHLTTGEAHVLGVPVTLPVLCADATEVLCRFLVEQVPGPGSRNLYRAWIEPVGVVSPRGEGSAPAARP